MRREAIVDEWSRVPRAARWLGLCGLIPFAAGAVGLYVTERAGAAVTASGLVAYAAIILGFLGGCRWGLASAGLGEGPRRWPLAASVVPAIYAWVVMLTPWPAAPVLLAIGFVALFGADLALTRQGGAPDWWPALRLPLTVGAVLSLLVAALA